MFKDFRELLEAARGRGGSHGLAVAQAADEAVLEAAIRAADEGLALPVLIGSAAKIRNLLEKLGRNPEHFRVEDAPCGQESQTAVELIRRGEAAILMKGQLDTKDLLGPVVKRENGLRTGRVMSHLAICEIPGYHKLLGATDCGMLIAPTLEEKIGVIENAGGALKLLGCEKPAFAVLAGHEKPNPKMPATVDADALARMNREENRFLGCAVEGPISYDVAMSGEIARHKGYRSDNCGNFDALVVPSLEAGNIMVKSWTVTMGAKMAGTILGAGAPIVLSSRGASAEEKFLSIALAVLLARPGATDAALK
jgi:phosphate butyryltransferase